MSTREREDAYLQALEEIYRVIKKRARNLRREDRIAEDLGIDSVAAVDLLIILEDRYSVPLLDDPRVEDLTTVGDLMDLLLSVAG